VSTGVQQFLSKYSQPLSYTPLNDKNIPLSFKQWINAHQGIIPGSEFEQYNTYLLNWFNKNSTSQTSTKTHIQVNYLLLLKQLQLFFSQEEAENWYNNVDVTNEKELLLAIPYFAKKLKEISLYYLRLRKAIKETRFLYNQVGTEVGTISQIQNYILNKYTQKPNQIIELPSSVWNASPALSAVKDTLTIQIEELYDTHSYFDHTASIPTSAYFNLNNPNLQTFLTTKGLSLTSTNWIYNLGVYSLSADIANTSTILSATSAYQQTLYDNILTLSNQLAEKYIGQEKYFVTLTTPPSTQKDLYDIQILKGDNSFYWPSGAYPTQGINSPRYETIALSATNLNTLGTAGTSVDLADTLFVVSDLGVQAAWLYNKIHDHSLVNMQALIKAGDKTIFRYPFPGYGVSAEDIQWSGFSLSADSRYFYLDDNIKQLVLDAYWTTDITTLTSTNILKLNDTTLVANKAYASIDYNQADKIRVWDNPPAYNSASYNTYNNSLSGAWLYKFNKTDISIAPNGNSTIVWPYEQIDPTQDYPDYYQSNLSNICTPTYVQNINVPYAIAGNALSSADVIYKIKKYNDTIDNAIECCWLYGQSVSLYSYSSAFNYIEKAQTIQQTSLQGILKPGTFTYFTWLGPSYTVKISDVFPTLQHQSDCKFITTPNTTYQDHNLCTCKQVLFTPFGCPGDSYSDYPYQGDFIAIDTQLPSKFNLDTYHGFGGSYPYYNSTNSFAWYRTNTKKGWGNGQWVKGGKNAIIGLQPADDMTFVKGIRYVYYRADDTRSNSTLPELVLRYNYNNPTYKGIWVGATYDTITNTWYSNNKASYMTINPGDNIIYSRANSTTFDLVHQVTTNETVAQNLSSNWSNYDFLTIGNSIIGTPQQVTVSYPVINLNNTQSPPVLSQNVNSYIWSLKAPNNIITFYKDTPSFTFTPYITGLYTVNVSAITNQLSSNNFYNSGAPLVNYVPVSSLPGTYPSNASDSNLINYLSKTYNYNANNLTILSKTTATPVSASYNNLPTLSIVYCLNSYIFPFSNIPAITAVSSSQVQMPSITSINTPVPGFVLNTPLSGWDYNTYKPKTSKTRFNDSGAVPFWGQIYLQKNINTKYKGIESWGTPIRLKDSYNLLTQPEFTNIQLNAGSYIEYTRTYPSNLNWIQPLDLYHYVNTAYWANLKYDTTLNSNLSYQLNNINTTVVVTPDTEATTLVFDNFINNNPVEVFYFAQNSFLWSITATPTIANTVYTDPTVTLGITALNPWGNFSNINNPTVAAFPSFENLYSNNDIGFFTPSNLGISVYNDQYYTTSLNTSSSALTGYFEDSGSIVNSRGLTLTDPSTPYSVTLEDNTWLKEITLSSPTAGNIRNSIFKKYQKFVPYQSTYETNPNVSVGLILPNSRQTPWGGKEDSTWTDTKNNNTSFTGVANTNQWFGSQILKQNQIQLDNWCTDIYGNQYGLYKDIKNIKPADRRDITGEVWVRSNNQFVSPASISLSGIFNTYIDTSSLYNDLTGTGIRKIDTFFDVLYVETSGAVIFEKINYDYTTGIISSYANETRSITFDLPSLSSVWPFATIILPWTTNSRIGETWFLPNEQKVILSMCGLSGNILLPELYQIDLNSLELKLIFPVTKDDIKTLQTNLVLDNTILSIDYPVLSYDDFKKEFVIAVTGKDTNNKDNLFEFSVNYLPTSTLNTVTVYTPTVHNISSDLPILTSPRSITIYDTDTLDYNLTVSNGPAKYEAVYLPSWVTLTNEGYLTGEPPAISSPVYHFATIAVTNANGTVYYSIAIKEIVNYNLELLYASLSTTNTGYLSGYVLEQTLSGTNIVTGRIKLHD